MKKRAIIFIFCIGVFFVIAVLPGVFAEVFVTKPLKQTYSLGDVLEAEFSVKRSYESYGYFEVEVVCAEEEILIYKNNLVVGANIEKNVTDISWPVRDMNGKCFLRASFDGEHASSFYFEISNSVRIDLALNAREFIPGQELTMNGRAFLANGQAVEGFAEVSMSHGNFTMKQNAGVRQGNFSFSYVFPAGAAPGNYSLGVVVFTKDIKNRVMNRDYLWTNISVRSLASSISVDVEESYKPPCFVIGNISVYDQGGNLMMRDILLKIYSPDGLAYGGNVSRNFSYFLAANSSVGVWRAEAFSGVGGSRAFNVLENKEIDIFYDNGRFKIINTGNVNYSGGVEVHIGNSSDNVTDIIDVSLGIGAEMIYSPNVSKGNYSVIFGNEEFLDVPITGALVAVSPKRGFPWYLLLVLALGILVYGAARLKKGIRLKRKESITGKLHFAYPCVLCVLGNQSYKEYIFDIIDKYGGQPDAIRGFFIGIFRQGDSVLRAYKSASILKEHFFVALHSENNIEQAKVIAMKLAGFHGKRIVFTDSVYNSVRGFANAEKFRVVSSGGRIFGVYTA